MGYSNIVFGIPGWEYLLVHVSFKLLYLSIWPVISLWCIFTSTGLTHGLNQQTKPVSMWSLHVGSRSIEIPSKAYSILLYVKCKYSKLICQFKVTWLSVLEYTNAKYHIAQSIFSNIACHHGATIVMSYCTIVTSECTILNIWHIIKQNIDLWCWAIWVLWILILALTWSILLHQIHKTPYWPHYRSIFV